MYESRVLEIERRLSLLTRQLDAVVSKLTQVQQEARQAFRQGWDPSQGGTQFFYIDPVAISAGSSAASQTIKYLVGGTGTTYATATVYNNMDAATVSTANKRIVVAPCGDGTYACVSQSC